MFVHDVLIVAGAKQSHKGISMAQIFDELFVPVLENGSGLIYMIFVPVLAQEIGGK